jgi:hypothetical protein
VLGEQDEHIELIADAAADEIPALGINLAGLEDPD